MGNDHETIINFKPAFYSRPSRKGMVRKCNGNLLFYHQKQATALKTNEPASPIVGCMGHIKRDKEGLSGTKGNSSFFQIKKIFSGKSVGHAPFNGDYAVKVRTIEMDPPLPVAKAGVKERVAVSFGRGDVGTHWKVSNFNGIAASSKSPSK